MLTPAQQLLGRTLAKGWTVIEKIPRSAVATGGCFSEGYIVESSNGMRAYLKALDYYYALSQQDPAAVLQAMTAAYNFERELLRKCKSSRLDRIIIALDDGSISIDPGNPAGVVQYIIFELADGDIRAHIATFKAFDLAWCLRCLHHITTGLFQLHRNGIAHQDLKPSNALVFKSVGTKLGDLGRACYDGHNGPSDNYEIPGDCSYAPPELLYGQIATTWDQRRFGCDLYLLGSMVVFFFSGVSMTSLLLDQLDDSQHWQKWMGTFEEILPHIRDAFVRAMEIFLSCVPVELQSDMSITVRYLCEPDPNLRGHPLNRRNPIANQYSLERFVSAFDLLAKKAELKILTPQNVQRR
jgi:serine/threonine protein kinase